VKNEPRVKHEPAILDLLERAIERQQETEELIWALSRYVGGLAAVFHEHASCDNYFERIERCIESLERLKKKKLQGDEALQLD